MIMILTTNNLATLHPRIPIHLLGRYFKKLIKQERTVCMVKVYTNPGSALGGEDVPTDAIGLFYILVRLGR